MLLKWQSNVTLYVFVANSWLLVFLVIEVQCRDRGLAKMIRKGNPIRKLTNWGGM